MLAINDITVDTILNMCRHRNIANIAMGVALGYSTGAIAQFVLQKYSDKYKLPDLGEYAGCGFQPSKEELDIPLKDTISGINRNRYFTVDFHVTDCPNLVRYKLDKEAHWNDLKSFMGIHAFRVAFVEAVWAIVSVEPAALIMGSVTKA